MLQLIFYNVCPTFQKKKKRVNPISDLYFKSAYHDFDKNIKLNKM